MASDLSPEQLERWPEGVLYAGRWYRFEGLSTAYSGSSQHHRGDIGRFRSDPVPGYPDGATLMLFRWHAWEQAQEDPLGGLRVGDGL